MGNTKSIQSRTWFDRLPTEIIYLIFEYLSTNDILYTFFHFNDRFKNLLLQNQPFLSYFELSTINLNLWRKIVPLIGSQIECLHINTIYLSFPLKSFPNLKSIIISSPHGFATEELKSIIKNKQFLRLESFRIEYNHQSLFTYFDDFFYNYGYEIWKKVFTNKTSLKIFEYFLKLPPFQYMDIEHFEINDKLQSLGLKLAVYEDIFLLLKYTPNLKYLNIQCESLSESRESIKKINVKLKQLDLKLTQRFDDTYSIDFGQLMNSIKPFSSSLICLSLNLADVNLLLDSTDIHTFFGNKIPFNIVTLQQWLESMIELKKFHFYAKLIGYLPTADEMILMKLQDWYWLEHNWSFGMHGQYLYTLPFHFDYLHDFPNDFDHIKSNNPEILINTSQLWYNVKSIELSITKQNDINLIHDIKMKLPNLSFIKFTGGSYDPICQTYIPFPNSNQRNDTDTILTKSSTIHFTTAVECEKEWLISSLPNLHYLIFPSRELSLIEFSFKYVNNLFPHTKYEKDKMEGQVYFILRKFEYMNEIYFSNIKHLIIDLNDNWTLSIASEDLLIKILKQSKNLQTFLIYCSRRFDFFDETSSYRPKFREFVDRLRRNKLRESYEIKRFPRYCLLLKSGFDEKELQKDVSSVSRIFSHLCYSK